MHEDLISPPESVRITEQDNVFRMGPAHQEIPLEAKIFSYASNHDVLNKTQLEEHLERVGIFSRSLDQFLGREIEEIQTAS